MTIVATVAITSTVSAQFKQQKTQITPNATRAYVWDMPLSKDMLFNNILPDNGQKIILAYDKNGGPLFILVPDSAYTRIQRELQVLRDFFLKDCKSISTNQFVGFDLAVSDIGKLSLLSTSQINNLATKDEKELARTLNEYKKYTLMGESVRPIAGVRNKDGHYIPLFAQAPTMPSPSPQTQGQPRVPVQEESLLDRLLRNRQ